MEVTIDSNRRAYLVGEQWFVDANGKRWREATWKELSEGHEGLHYSPPRFPRNELPTAARRRAINLSGPIPSGD